MQPTHFQKKVWFNTITAICLVAIGAIVVGGVWLSGEILAYLQPVLVPLAVAGILAYLIDPVVIFLQKKGLSRMKAIICVFILGLVSVGGFSVMIAVPLGKQVKLLNENKERYIKSAQKMFGELGKVDGVIEALPAPLQDLLPKTVEVTEEAPVVAEEVTIAPVESVTEEVVAPTLLNAFEEFMDGQSPELVEPEKVEGVEVVPDDQKFSWLDLLSVDYLVDALENNAPELASRVMDVVTRGASKFFGIMGYALGFIMVPIYLFFFLMESVKIKENWRKIVPLRASKFKDEFVSVVEEINNYLIAFFRGQVLVSIIDGFLVGLVLMIFGHPYAILIGVALAVLGVIPFIGNLICLVPTAITAYAHFSVTENQYWVGDNPWMYVLLVVGIFIVVQQINSLVTAPKIVGDSVGLHPMTVIFSMLFWSLLLGGFLGALLAVPMTASVKVLFSRYIWQRKVMVDGVLEESTE